MDKYCLMIVVAGKRRSDERFKLNIILLFTIYFTTKVRVFYLHIISVLNFEFPPLSSTKLYYNLTRDLLLTMIFFLQNILRESCEDLAFLYKFQYGVENCEVVY